MLFSLPFILVLSVFHGCDVRHGSEKRACRGGSVEACLSVARAYDSVGPDDFAYIFSMIFGYHHAAKVWYGEACQRGSAEGCHRFGRLSASDGDDWFESSLSEADELTGLTRACAAHVSDACDELGQLYDSESAFSIDEPTRSKLVAEGCDAGVTEACARIGVSDAGTGSAPHAPLPEARER